MLCVSEFFTPRSVRKERARNIEMIEVGEDEEEEEEEVQTILASTEI